LPCLARAACRVIAKIWIKEGNSTSKGVQLARIHMLTGGSKICSLNLKLHQMRIYYRLRFSSLLSKDLVRRLNSSKSIRRERYRTSITALNDFWKEKDA
jgi:hypothetical protein